MNRWVPRPHLDHLVEDLQEILVSLKNFKNWTRHVFDLDINFKPYNNKWNLCECIFSADCSWDYFTCTKRYGRWPMNKRCCNKRFDMCCKMMMKKKKNTRPLYQIPIRTTTKSPSGVSALSPVGTSQKPPESTTTNPDKIQMSKCLFMYL